MRRTLQCRQGRTTSCSVLRMLDGRLILDTAFFSAQPSYKSPYWGSEQEFKEMFGVSIASGEKPLLFTKNRITIPFFNADQCSNPSLISKETCVSHLYTLLPDERPIPQPVRNVLCKFAVKYQLCGVKWGTLAVMEAKKGRRILKSAVPCLVVLRGETKLLFNEEQYEVS